MLVEKLVREFTGPDSDTWLNEQIEGPQHHIAEYFFVTNGYPCAFRYVGYPEHVWLEVTTIDDFFSKVEVCARCSEKRISPRTNSRCLATKTY